VRRAWFGVTCASATLMMLATALSGCASLALQKALGPDPRMNPPVVERYEWAGRRGDELVVVYRVWGGHPRRHETRWTAIDLRTVTWTPGLGAPPVGDLGDQPDPVPDPTSVDAIPVVQRFGGPLADEIRVARSRGDAAGFAPVAIYARGGSAPELVVVRRDETGQLHSAAWALRPTEDPGRRESVPRALARGGAVLVDLVTMPVQLLLLVTGVVRVH
jgi:hypothetical protein